MHISGKRHAILKLSQCQMPFGSVLSLILSVSDLWLLLTSKLKQIIPSQQYANEDNAQCGCFSYVVGDFRGRIDCFGCV